LELAPFRVAALTDPRWSKQFGTGGDGVLLGLQDGPVATRLVGEAGAEVRTRRVYVHQFQLQQPEQSP
jgi:hypothetical protein